MEKAAIKTVLALTIYFTVKYLATFCKLLLNGGCVCLKQSLIFVITDLSSASVILESKVDYFFHFSTFFASVYWLFWLLNECIKVEILMAFFQILLQIAWAPGKGMKDKQWKDYWDVELGVSYIPLEKLDPQVDLVALEDGGTFDDDTMPDWMKNMRGIAQNMPNYMGGPEVVGIPLQAAPVVDQMMLQQGPPPGVPPFGLPPGMAPPGALLAPGAPVLLPGLMHQPRFHGFPPPSFDASQPPPGLRMAFPPPGMGATTTVPNVEGQGQDVEMEIEDQDQDHHRGPPRGNRSRWAGNGSEDDVQSRLRNLASEDNNGGPRSLLDLPPVDGPPQDRGKCGFHLIIAENSLWADVSRRVSTYFCACSKITTPRKIRTAMSILEPYYFQNSTTDLEDHQECAGGLRLDLAAAPGPLRSLDSEAKMRASESLLLITAQDLAEIEADLMTILTKGLPLAEAVAAGVAEAVEVVADLETDRPDLEVMNGLKMSRQRRKNKICFLF